MITIPTMVLDVAPPTCLVCHGSDQAKFMTKVGYEFFRCRRCGLEYSFPQPTDKQLEEIYGNYYGAWGLDKREALTEQMKKATFARILGLVSSTIPAGGKILDLGCASGFFLSLAQEKGFDPYGVEISAYGAQKSKERFGASHIYDGCTEDAHFAANPSKMFDAIFMTDYLEHVRDPSRVLETARQMLRENGCLVVTTPRVGSMSYYLMGKLWTQYKAEHLFYFSLQTISTLLNACGFSRIQHYPAFKCMTLSFLLENFVYYHSPFISPLAKGLLRTLPERIKRRKFWISLGDMIIVARLKSTIK